MKLYFITGNQNKLKEAKAILPEIEGLDIELTEIQSLDPHEIIKHKLEEARKKHEGTFIVEDTSLYVECLNGLPGPLIKWFMKSIGNEGICKIIKDFDNKKASAKCLIGFFHDKNIEYFEGSINGNIVAPQGTGFGWDPIFLPDNHEKTFAEMGLDEKNKISHRKLAFEKLKEHLSKL